MTTSKQACEMLSARYPFTAQAFSELYDKCGSFNIARAVAEYAGREGIASLDIAYHKFMRIDLETRSSLCVGSIEAD